jgi:uncharacterized protein YbjT (DUF2867 family)
MAGDALEMATVKRALTGVDVVTQSLGFSAGPEIILKPTRFFSEATRVLVTAMEEARVKRLICVTGFGAGDSRSRGGFMYNVAFHLLLGRVYDDKDVQERIVRTSKLDWVIVRPVILTWAHQFVRGSPRRIRFQVLAMRVHRIVLLRKRRTAKMVGRQWD